MNPDRLLMLVAVEANQHGYTVPQLGTDQARQAAERLIAAVGLTRPEPPRALPPSPVDSPTVMLQTVDPEPAPRRFQPGSAQLPTLDGRRRGYEYKGYGS